MSYRSAKIIQAEGLMKAPVAIPEGNANGVCVKFAREDGVWAPLLRQGLRLGIFSFQLKIEWCCRVIRGKYYIWMDRAQSVLFIGGCLISFR